MPGPAARAAVENTARDSYGRLIAYLASRTRDVAGAEDALGDAFVAAIEHWELDGVPAKPEAWLLHAARNRLIDAGRRSMVRERLEPALRRIAEEAQEVAIGPEPFPDERLKLMFVCAHPAIDAAARTPLMLQTVLGVDAARIASAYLTSPAAMSQRLVRAKTKIREAALPFRVPEPGEWDDRVAYVLDAIYSGYTAGWEHVNDSASTMHALAVESVALGRTLVQLMPDEAEARGLLALMLHCEARCEARDGKRGEFVPLDHQDTARWSRALIAEAEDQLRAAAAFQRMGRFQLEAAIQSIHSHRAESGTIDWEQIALLYEGLARLAPGIGCHVGRAVALAQSGRLAAGVAALEEIATERVVSYQPYWAARGHLLHLAGREAEARQAFTRAASLTDDPALRVYLMKRAEGDEDTPAH